MSSPPAPGLVREELARILASPGFVNAERLSRLLSFIVERTLDGRGAELKEYVLGTEVYDRGTGYDPRLDSIVRVEMRRLRTRLEEYYAGPGAESRLVMHVPLGSYVPQFSPRAETTVATPRTADSAETVRHTRPERWRRPASIIPIGLAALAVVAAGVAIVGWPAAGSAGGSDAAPRLAVLPFAHYPADADAAALAALIGDGVTGELVRGGRFEVVSRTSTAQFAAEPRSAPAVAQALGAQWLIEATVKRAAHHVHVEARLVDGARDRKIWVAEFTGAGDALDDLERRIAVAVSDAARRP
jgi:TolB-like protein